MRGYGMAPPRAASIRGDPIQRFCHEGGKYFPWSPVAAG